MKCGQLAAVFAQRKNIQKKKQKQEKSLVKKEEDCAERTRTAGEWHAISEREREWLQLAHSHNRRSLV